MNYEGKVKIRVMLGLDLGLLLRLVENSESELGMMNVFGLRFFFLLCVVFVGPIFVLFLAV